MSLLEKLGIGRKPQAVFQFESLKDAMAYMERLRCTPDEDNFKMFGEAEWVPVVSATNERINLEVQVEIDFHYHDAKGSGKMLKVKVQRLFGYIETHQKPRDLQVRAFTLADYLNRNPREHLEMIGWQQVFACQALLCFRDEAQAVFDYFKQQGLPPHLAQMPAKVEPFFDRAEKLLGRYVEARMYTPVHTAPQNQGKK